MKRRQLHTVLLIILSVLFVAMFGTAVACKKPFLIQTIKTGHVP